MNLTTGIVTAIIALAAIISPILVAVVNNSHQSKIKAQEFEYNNQVRQFEIYYNDKKTAFLEFIHAAGIFTSNRGDTEAYANLLSALNKAVLFCSHENKTALHSFLDFADNESFNLDEDLETCRKYSEHLHGIADCLSLDLESTKPHTN